MKRLALIILLFGLPFFAMAQSTDADRGYLVGLLEDNLSGAGRDIRITGFTGALSSNAKIEQLTIADEAGIWLTLKGAVLNWERSALLRGELKIAELSAESVELARWPATEKSGATPEASGFSLPELPASLDIAKLGVAQITLGEPLFGEAVVAKLAGSVQLAGGAGDILLQIDRTDGSSGSLNLTSSYSNVTRFLDMSLTLSESADGIVANMLDLPGLPSIDLTFQGAAPIDDFAADLTLKTDGTERLSGQLVLGSTADAEIPGAATTRIFNANIRGDIAPIFAPDYRPFFGDDVAMKLRGSRYPDGRLEIENLAVTTESMALSGKLALDSEGWPENLKLSGKMAAVDGQPLLLPSSSKTLIDLASLDLEFDAARSDVWSAILELQGLQAEGLDLSFVQLNGSGKITRGAGAALDRVDGDLALHADGITPASRAIMEAVGKSLKGTVSFEWQTEAPLTLPKVALRGDDYGLDGALAFRWLSEQSQLDSSGEVLLSADDLARFSSLATVPLHGTAQLQISGGGSVPSGAFAVKLDGKTQSLRVGTSVINGLLAGDGDVALSITRDIEGTRVDQLSMSTQKIEIAGSADIKTGATQATLSAKLADMAALVPGLNGAATLSGSLQQVGTQWRYDLSGTGPGSAKATLIGTATGDAVKSLNIEARLQSEIERLDAYAKAASMDLSGRTTFAANGSGDVLAGTFSATAEVNGSDLQIGQTHMDQLLVGESNILLDVRSEERGLFVFDRLDVKTSELVADMTGSIAPERSRLRFSAWMRDFGLFAQDLAGQLAASGVIERSNGSWQVDAKADGAGGTSAVTSGSVSGDGQRLDLTVKGSAPLALANRYIAPRSLSGMSSFDLTINGPANINSVSGLVRTEGALISIPNQRISLDRIAASARLDRGTANIEANSNISTGGSGRVSGTVGLIAPFSGDLAIALRGMKVSQPRLYETSVDGDLTVKGALAGGAKISGAFDLGTVDVSVAGAGSAALSGIPELRHVNEGSPVRRTRGFAGLLEDTKAQSKSANSFPIDLLIRAPSKIFVRGRGLDAELGGELRLGGNTNSLIPQGQFDLIRGRVDILGKRLTLSTGSASLQGNFDPYLLFVANTNVEDTTVSITIEGPASNPKISITSAPELPEEEVLSLLLFGRDVSQISIVQAAQLASAVNTLVGKGGGGIVNRLREKLGVDDLDVTTAEDGTVGVAVGKYISENIYSSVEIDSQGESEINLNLSVSPSVTVRGKLKSDGNTSVGVFVEKDY